MLEFPKSLIPSATTANRPAEMTAARLEELLATARNNPQKRAGVSMHRTLDRALHEFFLFYSDCDYQRPCKNTEHDLSLFLIRGSADLIVFERDGTINRVVPMGVSRGDDAYFCRIPKDTFFTLLLRSTDVVLFLACSASAAETNITAAPWAPAERDVTGSRQYLDELKRRVASSARAGMSKMIHMQRVNDMVFAATDALVPMTRVENQFVEETRRQANLDRRRICVHRSVDDHLHEMLMAFTSTTYIRPAMHIDKEESLLILQGFGTNVFFDDKGNVTSVVRLGPVESGRSFYSRVPADVYHCLIIESEAILAKETTSGPFRREQTVFPAWAPDGSDAMAVKKYLDQLHGKLKELA